MKRSNKLHSKWYPPRRPSLMILMVVLLQKYQDITTPDICEIVKEFFHHGEILKELNRSFIALI